MAMETCTKLYKLKQFIQDDVDIEGTLELRLDVVLEANILFNLVIDIF